MPCRCDYYENEIEEIIQQNLRAISGAIKVNTTPEDYDKWIQAFTHMLKGCDQKLTVSNEGIG